MLGDCLLLVRIPSTLDTERRGTVTMSFDGQPGERTYELTVAEEMLLAQLVSGKVRVSCGPSYFS